MALAAIGAGIDADADAAGNIPARVTMPGEGAKVVGSSALMRNSTRLAYTCDVALRDPQRLAIARCGSAP